MTCCKPLEHRNVNGLMECDKAKPEHGWSHVIRKGATVFYLQSAKDFST